MTTEPIAPPDSLLHREHMSPSQAMPHGTQPHCPSCAANAVMQAGQYVYAVGRIEVRFPTLALEREFKQRELAMHIAPDHDRGHRTRDVLNANGHLAANLCYLLMITETPAYILAPAGMYMREALLEAVALSEVADARVVVIGRSGPMASPLMCAGVLAPVLVCDQIYVFREEEWLTSLTSKLKSALAERKITHEHFQTTAKKLFSRVVRSTENVGATDTHRALNYLLVQHPGIFLAAAEQSHRRELDRIDTQIVQTGAIRKHVAVIFSFVDHSTGVAERLFTRVDVTEEWPFVVNSDGGVGPLGLEPYVESSFLAAPI